MKKQSQILLIHGGMTFRNKKDYLRYLKTKEISIEKKIKWTGDYLDKELGNNFQAIRPQMPLRENAKYEDWKMIFKKYIPFLKGKFILVGCSLGGIFLAKYLSENKLPKKALSIYLVCPPFDDSLSTEDLAGGFMLRSDLSLIEENSNKVYLLFSKDDDIVPVSHAKKYQSKLKKAKLIIYKSKNGHFKVPKFPEIIRMIQNDVRGSQM